MSDLAELMELAKASRKYAKFEHELLTSVKLEDSMEYKCEQEEHKSNTNKGSYDPINFENRFICSNCGVPYAIKNKGAEQDHWNKLLNTPFSIYENMTGEEQDRWNELMNAPYGL